MIFYNPSRELTHAFPGVSENQNITILNYLFMNVELLTKEDLKNFKTELLNDIREMIKPGTGQSKQWLKSNEVRKLLSISPGTLQNLRINGILRYTKVGGMMYYKLEDINKILEGNHR
jgi:uncharacterized protein YfkK (UPF0435 family)